MEEKGIFSQVEVKEGGRRRERMKIIADILEAATNGTKKTRIMFKADLNFKQLKRYLPLLLKKGLIKTIKLDGQWVYKTTKKGLDFLEKYKELSRL